MNTIDFTKQGGFPFDQDVLGFLQNSILAAAGTASLGGQTYILSGCEKIGGNIANGIVVINGEIMPFAGGAEQAKVVIIEQTENMNYEDGSVYPSIKTRFATFGDDGVTNLQWSSFKRNTPEGVLARLERLERIAAPFLEVTAADGTKHRGGMVLWKKPAILIPAGWQEVVDWRGRLPMGWNPDDPAFDEVGEIGGSKQHQLTVAQLPEHDHTMSEAGEHQHEYQRFEYSSSGDNQSAHARWQGVSTAYTSKAGAHKHDIGKTGQNQPFSLLNPYRIVMFIEYTGA